MVSDPAIILSNHSSLLDYLIIVYLATQVKDVDFSVPRVSFFTWFTLWSLPNVRTIVNMARVDENWELDTQPAIQTFKNVLCSSLSEWIVLFPEVNTFSDKAKAQQDLFARKYHLPKINNLLYPRPQSLLSLSKATRDNFKFGRLYDVTICYYHDTKQGIKWSHPTLLDLIAFNGDTIVHVHVKQRSIKKISRKKSHLERWLEKTWLEKDAIMQADQDKILSLQNEIDGQAANN